jgi:small-conductance mechanosensitive channel
MYSNLLPRMIIEVVNSKFYSRRCLSAFSIFGVGFARRRHRGLIIRVWIKTQPLKQWDVAREFRRRLKIVLDEAGISISVPQQAIWVNDEQSLNFHSNGKGN